MDIIEIRPEHFAGLKTWLAEAPLETHKFLGVIAEYERGVLGLEEFEMEGVQEDGRWIGLALWYGPVHIHVTDERAIDLLLPYVASRVLGAQQLIGRKEIVDALYETLELLPWRIRFDRLQHVLEADRATLAAAPRTDVLREATPTDRPEMEDLLAAMMQEELQLDPRAEFPEAFQAAVARLIADRRFMALGEGDRTVATAHLASLSPQAAEIAGVYTRPEFRQQGYGKRAVAEVAHRTLEQTERVLAHINDFNTASLATFRSLGFKDTPVVLRTICWEMEESV